MAEQKQQQQKEAKPAQKKGPQQEEQFETLVRIFGYDIPSSRHVFAGLTRIKGISWSISNAVCLNLNIPPSKKISDLTKEEIARIEKYLTDLQVPSFLKNRRYDPETGQTSHIFGTDLDMTREFDIKRLRKIRSYKGLRHASGQPVRGQRTRSHFRRNKGKSSGMAAKKAPAAGGKK